jgi:hypothetical protein
VVAFFDQRWVLKIAILSIALLGIIPLYFFPAMLLFDEAYLMMRWYGRVRSSWSRKPLVYLQKPAFTLLTFNFVFALFFGAMTFA